MTLPPKWQALGTGAEGRQGPLQMLSSTELYVADFGAGAWSWAHNLKDVRVLGHKATLLLQRVKFLWREAFEGAGFLWAQHTV